jgi:hypothetical protein
MIEVLANKHEDVLSLRSEKKNEGRERMHKVNG